MRRIVDMEWGGFAPMIGRELKARVFGQSSGWTSRDWISGASSSGSSGGGGPRLVGHEVSWSPHAAGGGGGHASITNVESTAHTGSISGILHANPMHGSVWQANPMPGGGGLHASPMPGGGGSEGTGGVLHAVPAGGSEGTGGGLHASPMPGGGGSEGTGGVLHAVPAGGGASGGSGGLSFLESLAPVKGGGLLSANESGLAPVRGGGGGGGSWALQEGMNRTVVDNIVSNLERHHAEIVTIQQDSGQVVRKLLDAWRGRDANQFEADFAHTDRGAHQALTLINEVLKQIREQIQQQEKASAT